MAAISSNPRAVSSLECNFFTERLCKPDRGSVSVEFVEPIPKKRYSNVIARPIFQLHDRSITSSPLAVRLT